MPSQTPPTQPEREMVDFLIDQWDPTQVRGFDASSTTPSADAFLATATTIDNVGAVYPSLVVTFSNETSGGETTFDFLTDSGPGQSPDGTLLVTVRAQDRESGYVGDSASYSAVEAETIVDEIADHAADICRDHWNAPGTEFEQVGAQRGPDAPDDFEETPPVRIAQRQLDYSALWVP